MSESMLAEKFEQIALPVEKEMSENLVARTLTLGRIAMQFARVDRVPRYCDGERESDVEHSYMLALVAPELAQSLELPLDHGLLSQFAIVHDLIELKTNDVATFLLSEQELHQKEAAEAAALEQLLQELPPHTAHLLERYEHQEEPEARFVRFVDKLLPLVVDILGEGKRVLQEDYDIHSTAELQSAHTAVSARLHRLFANEYPALNQTHTALYRLVEQSIDFAE